MRRLLNRRWVRELSWLFLILCVAAVAAPIATRREAQRRLAAGRSNLSACQVNLKDIGTALEMYSTDNGGRFPAWGHPVPRGVLGWVVPTYLKVLPTCPAAGHDTYSDSYVASSNPDEYIVECRGSWHRDVGLEEDRPRFTSTTGLASTGVEGGSIPCASPGAVTHLPMDLRVCGVACGMSAPEVEEVLTMRRGERLSDGTHEWNDQLPLTVSFDSKGRVQSVQGCSVSFNGHTWDLSRYEHGLDPTQRLGAPTAVSRGSGSDATSLVPSIVGRWRYTDVDQRLSLVLYGLTGREKRGWAELRREP